MASTTISYGNLPVKVPTPGVSLHRYTPFLSPPPGPSRTKLVKDETTANKHLDRSCGCMVGLGIGDTLGAPLEFLPVTATTLPNRPHFDSSTFKYLNTPPSRFMLEEGQWTDDTSMAMCLADGLIENDGAYVGSATRTKYWLWWNEGLNNAFRKSTGNVRHSVGLGGNIKQSLDELSPGTDPSNDYKPPNKSQDAGNGSLMRLAPVPVCFFRSQWSAMTMAKQSR
jgi:ADP-ribosyl-[dinitrogen reductase] hydrolase